MFKHVYSLAGYKAWFLTQPNTGSHTIVVIKKLIESNSSAGDPLPLALTKVPDCCSQHMQIHRVARGLCVVQVWFQHQTKMITEHCLVSAFRGKLYPLKPVEISS